MKPVAELAQYEDCEEILALQKLAFQSEAILYDDPTIPPLTQTLEELRADWFIKRILKIVIDNKIVASVRAKIDRGVAHIERVMVHPDYQKQGLGYVLMESIEERLQYSRHDFDDGEKLYCYSAHTYKLYTGNKSFSNMNWYKKLGYTVVGEDVFVSPKLSITKMIKDAPKPLKNEYFNPLKIKVCGMRDAQNISELIQLPIDYIGFIFYEKSARYVELKPELKDNKRFQDIKKVGVFVNAEIGFVLQKIKEFDLDIVQLHGKETPDYVSDLVYECMIAASTPYYMTELKRIPDTYVYPKHVKVWKAFSVDDTFDFNETEPYEDKADKFLFDTKTPQHGGSGQKFDWTILRKYTGQTPFFLSGGISASDTEGVKNIQHPQFFGLDLNSKFEISPALKDTQMLNKFLESLDLL
jgi:phosphoribosylanthranilate isomerase